MTDLEPHLALELHQQRMKIDDAFRALKSLLGLDKIVNKTQRNPEQIIALLVIAYAIGPFVAGKRYATSCYALPVQHSNSSEPAHDGATPGSSSCSDSRRA
jgi:hypothetical protein